MSETRSDCEIGRIAYIQMKGKFNLFSKTNSENSVNEMSTSPSLSGFRVTRRRGKSSISRGSCHRAYKVLRGRKPHELSPKKKDPSFYTGSSKTHGGTPRTSNE